MRFPTSLKFLRRCAAAALLGALLLLAGTLVACTASIPAPGSGQKPILKVGEASTKANAALVKAEEDGEIPPQSSNDVFATILNVAGYLLLGGAGVGAVGSGATYLAKRQVRKADAAPFEDQFGRKMSEDELIDTALNNEARLASLEDEIARQSQRTANEPSPPSPARAGSPA